MGVTILSKSFVRELQKIRAQHFLSKRWKSSACARPKPLHGISYLSVPAEQPLLGVTIGQLLDESVKKYGDLEAFVEKDREIRRTFSDLLTEVNDLAEGFLEIGLIKGDRLGIWGPNGLEWWLTSLAAAKAGLILVNINPAYEGSEILYSLQKVGMRGLVMAEGFRGRNYYDILASVIPSVREAEPGRIKATEAPELSTVISMAQDAPNGSYSFEEVIWNGSRSQAKKRLAQIESSVQFDDVYNIQFTSGTTGKPKGVMLTHHNMVNNSFLIAKRMNLSASDKICVPVPFFHCYGGVGGILASIHTGSKCVIPSPGFDPQQAIRAVEDEKCTILYGTPTMHVDMTGVAEGKTLSSLRMAVTAGSICPEELARRVGRVFNCKVMSFYGLTETSPVIFQTLPDDSDDKQFSTVGYPQEHTEIKVVDTDGRVVPIGETGEICARGYMTMLGYWRDEEKTAEVLKDSGWFHTGDLFVMDDTGYGRIVGRLKDMIIRGGENIYPKEIEELLHQHPKIMEAHVFSLPDERLGEVVAAWVRLKDGEIMTEADLRAHYKGKIAGFKIPKHIFFRKDFPKTTSGKIQKFRMRDESMKVLGLGSK